MDFKYTAHLEEELDEIEEGTKQTLEVLNEFYGDFSKDLKKRGFSFVGSTIMYAHMQAVGMVNDHVTSCFRHRQVPKR